jgi:hypothetical protein
MVFHIMSMGGAGRRPVSGSLCRELTYVLCVRGVLAVYRGDSDSDTRFSYVLCCDTD